MMIERVEKAELRGFVRSHRGTIYAESTVFKTMQRMKEAPGRPPYTRLQRVGRQGFRLVELERA